MRDMGTEMTPIASQEPSRTGTPAKATTPTRSPNSSRPSTPPRGSPSPSQPNLFKDQVDSNAELSQKELQMKTRREIMVLGTQLGKLNIAAWASKEEEDNVASTSLKTDLVHQPAKSPIEIRASAWEEAEKAKYMARFTSYKYIALLFYGLFFFEVKCHRDASIFREILPLPGPIKDSFPVSSEISTKKKRFLLLVSPTATTTTNSCDWLIQRVSFWLASELVAERGWAFPTFSFLLSLPTPLGIIQLFSNFYHSIMGWSIYVELDMDFLKVKTSLHLHMLKYY